MAIEFKPPKILEPESYTDSCDIQRWHEPEGCNSRKDFLALTLEPERSSYALPGADNNLDHTVYIKDPTPTGITLNLDHRAIYFEGALPEGSTLRGRTRNIISARALAPGTKIERGMIVIVGETEHLRPSEQSLTKAVPPGTPILVVPEDKRMEVFARLTGMLPEWRTLPQEYLDSLSDRDFEVVLGLDRAKPDLDGINETLLRFKEEGLLSNVIPNYSGAIDMSLFSSKSAAR